MFPSAILLWIVWLNIPWIIMNGSDCKCHLLKWNLTFVPIDTKQNTCHRFELVKYVFPHSKYCYMFRSVLISSTLRYKCQCSVQVTKGKQVQNCLVTCITNYSDILTAHNLSVTHPLYKWFWSTTCNRRNDTLLFFCIVTLHLLCTNLRC